MKTILASRPGPLAARRLHLLLGLAGMLWMLGITLPLPARLVLVPAVAALLYLQAAAEADTATVTAVRTPRTTGPTGGAR
ncbi:hypothetical protein ACIRYZ_38825 [Kitasatospora sp. NPDC101155]|uniref:hypothetical protein n=1 Tax=Kitasatospora sp. NPDC101155 TaxID=3364097 RepID=UPI00382C64A8